MGSHLVNINLNSKRFHVFHLSLSLPLCMFRPGGVYVEGLIKDWLNFIKMCPNAHTFKQQVIDNEPYTDWWAALEENGPYGDHFPNDRVPVVHRAGWWDIFQFGQLAVFNGAVREADPTVRGKQYLFVEPLGHCALFDSFGFPQHKITDWFTLSVAMFQNDWANPVFNRQSSPALCTCGAGL